MKKYYILFLLFIFTTGVCQNKRILFLGNSYTGTNDLPGMFSQMVTSTGQNCIIDSNTPGGYTFNLHTTNSTTQTKIQQGNWDFVILQEQSQIPSFPDDYVNTNCFPYAEQLNNQILQYSPCAETVFYMTWGRQNGDSQFCATNPPVCTYEGMDDLLRARYITMAQNNNAIVSPVGAVWRYIRTNYPEINLYSGDGSHPSVEGTYAAALTFFTSIYRQNPNLVTFSSGLNNSITDKIKIAVTNVLYNQMSNWFIGNYDISANFSAQLISGNTYQFNNTSINFTSSNWDFGNGNTSTSTNPIQVITNSNASITLTVTDNCNKTSTFQTTLQNLLNNNSFELDSNKITFNNPVKDVLEINNIESIKTINIYNLQGKLVKKLDYLKNTKFNLSFLNSGIYLLHIELLNSIIVKEKLIKE